MPFLRSLTPAAVVGMLAFGALPADSQTDSQTVPPTPSETADESVGETTCAYDPNSGAPDPLGERASLTIAASEGNTAFIYERLPATVSSNSSDRRAEVDNKRTLMLYETSVAEARQLLLDDSTYYAVLLGLAPDDPFVARGFETINQTLVCTEGSGNVDEVVAPAPTIPQSSAPPLPQPPVQ